MFKKLLLAVDINDPEGTLASAEAAVGLARHEAATLHVVNVVPDQGMAIVGASLAPDHNETVEAAAKRGLENWAQSHIPDDVSAVLHVARGTIYDQIIHSAEKLAVDCIVVGAHSPTLKDYLIGPNAARVARHASQSVFVVRQ
ncbi:MULTISPECIES: universal stress protein [unclassified Tateyamaria]|jgi:nucleotide-binding universal stress UspA family protein|uniref:universal stress protein n=2 Tax=Tateyamaria TaxID=299261 RepID=UPI000D54D7E0|nr:universal stress protein [Tateyamaria sp. Alg231-49]